MTILLPALSTATFQLIGVFSLLMTVGLLLACGSSSPAAVPPTTASPTAAAAVSTVPSATNVPTDTAAPPARSEQTTPVANPNPTPAEAVPSPAAEQPTESPPPDAEPATPAERDRAILTALYHATDGPNWADNTNWLTDAPLSEWYGVWVDSDTLGVRQLILFANRLKGEIPPELGDLADLKYLNLNRNLLSGCIPLSLVYRQRVHLIQFPFEEEAWSWGNLQGCKSPDREALGRVHTNYKGW